MSMSRPRARRTKPGWLLAAVLLAVAAAGCGGATASGGSPASSRASVAGAVAFDPAGWRTDFARHSVPLGTISAGGPPRFVGSREPVIAVVIGGHARAYPLAILLWHEIVNDTLDRQPIAVTYCPLCNTAIVFDRRPAGRLLTFGTTSNLRNSDLVIGTARRKAGGSNSTATRSSASSPATSSSRSTPRCSASPTSVPATTRGRCSPATPALTARTAKPRTRATTSRVSAHFSTVASSTRAFVRWRASKS